MIRYVAFGCIFLVVIQTVLSWSGNLDYNSNPDEEQQRRMFNYLRGVKRTASWMQSMCGKWYDFCLPGNGQGRPGLTCCDGYTCQCNLWNTNCKCKSKMFG